MARTFGPTQLYAVEEIVNAVADALIHVGFRVGEVADEQHYDGTPLVDMSGIVDRLLEARTELESAIGLARAYELHRVALTASA
jgi:hypothetical protein